MEQIKESRKARILPSILAALAFTVILFVEIPFEVYGTNQAEFMFSLWDFLPISAAMGLCVAAVIVAVLMLLPEKVYHILYMLVAATAFLLFLQSNFLNGDYVYLIGDNMGVEPPTSGQILVNLVIWILFELVAVLAGIFWNKTDWIRLCSLILSLMVVGTQVVGAATVMLTKENVLLTKLQAAKKRNPEFVSMAIDYSGVNTVSQTNNILYFCIDRFDEIYAEEAYAEKPELFDIFDGFTWYQDHISKYSHTFPAVANMLTGAEFTGDMGRADYLDDAYRNETRLTSLCENGYDVNLYASEFYCFDDAYDLPDCVSNRVEDDSIYDIYNPIKLAIRMVEIGAFRAAPLALKDLFSSLSTEMLNAYSARFQQDQFMTANKDYYDYLSANGFTLTDEKRFSYVHIDGCHYDVTDENFNELPVGAEGKSIWSLETSFKVLNEFLTAMKEAGVYEDATIIVTGDHAAAINDFTPLNGSRRVALFVKPAGSAETPMETSQKQTSHDNIWATVLESEGLEVPDGMPESVFSVPEGDRTRTYVWHTYENAKTDEYVYEITGAGADFSNWKIVKQERYKKYIMN